MKIHLIAAARPNFMKIAPLYHALKRESWAEAIIIHTGQHYDLNMSDVFFSDMGLPKPDLQLGVGSGTHGEQTGKTLIAYERVLLDHRPDLVIVVGDVNSTVAATLAAAKLGIKTAHLEAGLRSYDRTMPEEINRIVTDAIADILWTPSPDADKNLEREGVPSKKIRRVGNIMIDSLEMLRNKIHADATYSGLGLRPGCYGLVTLHRPSNVDTPQSLKLLCESLILASEKIHLVFPVHPRTRKNLSTFGLMGEIEKADGLQLIEPLNYIRFMNLLFHCCFALTDSGGIQEETTYLGIPCITLRPNTERPITVHQGTNRLCKIDGIEAMISSILNHDAPAKASIDLWDGHTAERVVRHIQELL